MPINPKLRLLYYMYLMDEKDNKNHISIIMDIEVWYLFGSFVEPTVENITDFWEDLRNKITKSLEKELKEENDCYDKNHLSLNVK